MSKNLYIKTYGCQMNVYDSDKMKDLMSSIGYKTTEDPEDADMIIINTCHIREKASEKLFSDLGRLKKIKDKKKLEGNDVIITVAGCVAQAEGEEIIKRSNAVDIVVGPESYQTLPDLVGRVVRNKTREINLDFAPNNKFDTLNINSTTNSSSNFVTIQEGCDKFCTFCVVPYTRGSEYSRNFEDVLNEVKKIADNKNLREVYLLGQNVNAYHGLDTKGQTKKLSDLIKEISKIDSIKRIRYTTSHPKDMTDDLIDAHGECEKLMPFLHLPIQSGSDNILAKMNRKHNRQAYFKIIEKLRKARPDIGLSSDFIVGFPGESDKDFNDTIDLVNEIKFSQCYSFKYSPRAGTPAHDAINQIDEEIKSFRLAILQNILSKQQVDFNKNFEGKVIDVLFEKEASKSKKKENNIQLWGKSPWLQSVVVDIEQDSIKEKYYGKITPIRIIKSRPSSLFGEII